MAGGFSPIAELLILTGPLVIFLLFPPKKYVFKKIHFLFFIWLLVQLFSLPESASFSLSINSWFKNLAIFLFLLIFSWQPAGNKLRLTAGMILTTALILSGWQLLALVLGRPPGTTLNLVYAYHGHSHLAAYLLIALPLAVSLFWNNQDGKKNWLWFSLSFFYFLSLLLTFSRAALAFWLLALIFLFAWIRPRSRFKRAVFWLMFGFSLATLLVIVFVSFKSQVIAGNAFNQRLARQLIKPFSLGRRLSYWRQALMVVREKPFLGSGAGTFEIASSAYLETPSDWSRFAHNFYLQQLSETGLIGFLALIFLTIYVLKKSLLLALKRKKQSLLVGSLGAIWLSAALAFFDFDWHFTAIFLVFFSLFLALEESEKAGFKPGKKTGPVLVFICLGGISFIFGAGRFLAHLYSRQALVFSQRNEKNKAADFFSLARFLGPWERDVWLESAFLKPDLHLSDRGNISRRLFAANRRDPFFYYRLGQHFQSVKDWPSAAVFFEAGFNLSPLRPLDQVLCLEQIYDQLKEDQKKEELYLLLAGRFLSHCRAWLEEPQSQIEIARRFLFNWAKAKFDRGESADVLTMIGETGPDCWGRYRPFLAKVYYWAGLKFPDRKSKVIVSYWQRAAAACPEITAFALELGHLYLDRGDYFQAEIVFKQCLARYPADSGGCDSGLALAKNRQVGKKPGAWEWFILNQAPDYF